MPGRSSSEQGWEAVNWMDVIRDTKQEKTFKSIWALSFNRIGERKKKKKTKNKKRPVTQITRVLSDHTQHRHAVIFCY